MKDSFNLPNCLTVIRMLMTVVFVLILLQPSFQSKLSAMLIFILAAFTDWLDGYWARRYNLISSFGKIMDPIADKFLTLSAFGVFSVLKVVPLWIVLLIAIREILLTVLRFVAVNKGKVLAAEPLGKYKTVLQMATIILILIFLCIYSTCAGAPQAWKTGILISMYLTLGITLISGITNLINNREAYFG